MSTDETMTGRLCKVLMSAEDYAFGPVAKCTNIARGLKERGFETVFVGQGTALQYSRSESTAFDRVLPLDRLDSLAEVTDGGCPYEVRQAAVAGFCW